jgi:PAS domain S-box-containing protein
MNEEDRKRISDWVDIVKRGESPGELAPADDEEIAPLVEGLNLLARKVRDLQRRHADATREFRIEIDSSHRRESELQEREEEARRFLEHNLDVYFFYRHDTEGVFTYVSPSVEQVLGYSPETYLTHYQEYQTDSPINEEVRRHTELSIQGVKQPPYKVDVRHKNGSVRCLEVIEVPVFGKDGEVMAVEGIAHDVTDLEEALAALQESQEQFKGIFENAMVGLYRTTPAGHILVANPALVRMLGYESLDALQKRRLEESGFEPTYPRSRFKEVMERDGRVIGLESAWKRRDGTILYVRESARAVMDDGGKVKYYEGTVEDVTLRREAVEALREAHEELELRVQKRTAELSEANKALEAEIAERKQVEEEMKKAQGQLLRAQRLEAVGNLAGGIAHDFNNLLVAILGYADLCTMKAPEDSPLAKYLQAITDSATRAGSLTKQLLLFSRGQPMELVPLDINSAVSDLLVMLGRIIGENITVETDLAEDLAVVLGDRANLDQVLMNLIVNARDAMDRGGTLKIVTANVDVEEQEARDIVDVEPGKFVRITVIDSGEGIDRDLADRIFEPFFTTKRAGKGTGLGLSVAYGIVKKHKGWIQLKSEPGRGATFRVHLPAAAGTQTKRRTTEVILEKLRGEGERILLVEDQADVSDFATTALSENGYEILRADTAEKALATFAQNAGRFDLVFSDVVLPGLSGMELAHRLRSKDPHVPILLCSGYTGDKVDPGEIEKAGYRFLRKPYTLVDLLRAVQDSIDSDGS